MKRCKELTEEEIRTLKEIKAMMKGGNKKDDEETQALELARPDL